MRLTLIGYYLLCWVVGVLLVMCCGGCKGVRYVEMPVVHTQLTARVDSFSTVDSLYVGDSTVVMMQGQDTVRIEHWRTYWRDRWRERLQRDTVIVRDTVSVAVRVPAELTRWERTKVDYGGYAMLILAVLCVFEVYRLARKFA